MKLYLLLSACVCFGWIHVAASADIESPANADRSDTSLTIFDGDSIDLYDVPLGTEKSITFQIKQNLQTYRHILLFMEVDDIDQASEGSVCLNGSKLSWAPSMIGESIRAGAIAIDKTFLKPGTNVLRFSLDSNLAGTTGGYKIINSIVLQFYRELSPARQSRILKRAAFWTGRLRRLEIEYEPIAPLKTPFPMAPPNRPEISDRIMDIRAFGAVGDGQADNTEACPICGNSV